MRLNFFENRFPNDRLFQKQYNLDNFIELDTNCNSKNVVLDNVQLARDVQKRSDECGVVIVMPQILKTPRYLSVSLFSMKLGRYM